MHAGDIFISYRREDVPDDAAAIAKRLRQEFGDDAVFFDEQRASLQAGAVWDDAFPAASIGCRALIAVKATKGPPHLDPGVATRSLFPSLEMNDTPPGQVPTEVNEGNEEAAGTSFPSLPSVTSRGVHDPSGSAALRPSPVLARNFE
jgi:hypothetical protein